MSPIKPKIPILGSHEIQCFSQYFNGINKLISKRLALRFFPGEEHLTSILCELLDEEGAQLHSLPYSVSNLNTDLRRNGGLLQANISIKTSDYNKNQEHNNTQSDLGIIIDYQDHIEPSNDFINGVLIQAKKLFPSDESVYNFSSQYKYFDPTQHRKIKDLNERLTKDRCNSQGVKYLMYNPPLVTLSKKEQQFIQHQQMKRDATCIFDFSQGLHRYREIAGNNSDTLELGCLFVSVDDINYLATNHEKEKKDFCKFTLGQLVNKINVYQSSLSWFLIFDMMIQGIGCFSKDCIDLIRSGEQLYPRLDVIPPKYSISIKISAGDAEQ